ncbi:hypothetical protein [Streptomyces sp. NPDC050287]|uniref:hypothetical protein n=1 Tax=Streptomyces sp. NPDC050287 TaxID=3365608 RepID=UPI00378DF306
MSDGRAPVNGQWPPRRSSATFAVGIDSALTAAVFNPTLHTAAHQSETLHALHRIEAVGDERRK